MRLSLLSGMMLSFLLLGYGGTLLASEADELRERAKAMRKEAAGLAGRGHEGEAEQLEKEAVKLHEAAERIELKAKGRGGRGNRSETERNLRHLKERLEDLLAKERSLRGADAPEKELDEVREQIAGTEREIHALHTRHHGMVELPSELRTQAEKLEAATRRIHHLHVAAENLKLAGAHDLAHQVMDKAEAMERDVQEAKKQLATEMHKLHVGGHESDELRELRAEIERLRAEVKELRQKVKKQ